MLKSSVPAFLLFVTLSASAPCKGQQPDPNSARDVAISSSKDGSVQRALFFAPKRPAGKIPLLVFLHSWSTDYKTAGGWDEVLDESRKRAWAVVVPNFRGPNQTPEACGSDLAVQDVLDSVEFARKNASIDEKRIFLLGSSGGGFMGLLMAARAPRLWAAISVWVPITNLATWHEFSEASNSQYYKMMDQCFGGPPDTPERQQEYRRRSPIFFLSSARGIPIHIDAGIHDGHERNAVPLRQSLEAFNVLAKANGAADLIGEADIDAMTKEARVADHLAKEVAEDSARKEKILFRRTAGPVTLTIFDGGHSVDVRTGIRYFQDN